MDRFAHPPAGKRPAYYVVLRPRDLSPKQADIMYQVALLMIEQNHMCVPVMAIIYVFCFLIIASGSRPVFQTSSILFRIWYRNLCDSFASRVSTQRKRLKSEISVTIQDTTGEAQFCVLAF